MSLLDLSIRELQEGLRQKKFTVRELVEASFARIREVEDQIRAFVSLDEDKALAQAQSLDEGASGERGPLWGLPMGLKDNISTEGVATTCASRFLENYVPIFDATVTKKLRDGQAVMVGKQNMDEFAMGSSTETSAFYPTRNPWDRERVPGGSSGGSAAAVAAREVVFSLGSDTGGSIRQPAAYCGVVGLKPTYGRVSRFGLVAFASSMDQIGPLTKNVEDCACVLQVIAGHDPNDSTSAPVEVPDYLSALTGDVKGLRIAVPKEYLGSGVDAGVRERILEALKVLEGLGASWEEVEVPHLGYAVATYHILAYAEGSSNLSRLDGIRYGKRVEGEDLVDLYLNSRSQGFGPEVKRRILFGTHVLRSGNYEAYYVQAQKVRTLIRRDFEQLFEKYDVIMGPTAPTPAFRIGEQVNDPLTLFTNDLCTIPANLAGVPAISVPCGLVDGLPVGLQIIGRPFDESTILRVAHAFEQATEHHKLKPNL